MKPRSPQATDMVNAGSRMNGVHNRSEKLQGLLGVLAGTLEVTGPRNSVSSQLVNANRVLVIDKSAASSICPCAWRGRRPDLS
jgi:hypothetical protein